MFKAFRIFVLLLILIIVAGDTYLTKYRAISWDESLWVGIYPINASGDASVDAYIETLHDKKFDDIKAFFKSEAEDYGISLEQPFEILMAHSINELPPPPPVDRNMLNVMWWSLKLRYWAFTNNQSDFSPDIKVFVIYHPYQKNTQLAHSLGIERGMIGVVHGFAHHEMEGKNNLVIAHELLHTLGATDKYSYETGEPVYPDGYAEPDKTPRYPQTYAELMGGTIPTSASESTMPRSLRKVLIGDKTAREINWLAEE